MPAPSAVLITLLFLSGCGSPTAVERLEPRDLSFLARDGVRLVGTVYTPAEAGSAGLILVHGDKGTRADFDSFAEKAQREGYHVLALDLRGHGGSRATQEHLNNAAESGTLLDLEAARLALIESGADSENLAVVGAEEGANLALMYAGSHSGIQAVVLLTPERAVHGIAVGDSLRGYGVRPVLLMVSAGDPHGVATVESLRAMAPGHCEVREYQGSAEGTEIFNSAATSSGQALLWLSGIIGPEAVMRNQRLNESTAQSMQEN